MSEYTSDLEVPDLIRQLDLRIAALEAGPRGLWQKLTLSGAWVQAGVQPAYIVDDFGFVHYRGRISSGASGGVAFNIPVGVRPGAGSDLYPVAAVSGTTPIVAMAAIDGTSATCELYYAAAITTLSLRGICYLAEK